MLVRRALLVACLAAALMMAAPAAAHALAPDAYEDDDTTATANVAVIGAQQDRSLETSADIDWLRVDVTAGQRYLFGTWGAADATDTADTVLYLYDSAGRLIDSDDDDGPSLFSGFGVTATSTTTWWLAVDVYGSSTGEYMLVVSEVSTVAGHVRDAAGAPVSGAQVLMYTLQGNSTWSSDGDFMADTTGADGSFEVESIPGQHRLGVSSGSEVGYYDGVASLADATEFPVANDEALLGYDVTLSGLSSADAYESDGTTAAAVAVTVPTVGQWRSINPTGDVDIVRFNVTPGRRYAVGTFGDDAFTDDADTYLTLYDSNASTILATDDDSGPGTFSLLSHTATQTETWYVRVRGYSSSTDGAYRLAVSEASTISGTVRDGAGDPIESCHVYVYGPSDSAGWSNGIWATTAADGSYELDGLVASPAKLRFMAPTGYEDEWHSNASSEDSATQFTLGSADSESVDATLALSSGAEISGTVTDRLGNGLSGLKVHASSDATDAWDYTYIGGAYTLDGLPGGDYTVWFEDTRNEYLDEYYDDVRAEADAEMVTVEDGGIAVSVDASLTRAGGIAGSVENSQGVAASGIWAYLYQATSGGYALVDQDLTGATGDFAMGDLEAGRYTLRFVDTGGTYMAEWYEDSATFDGSTLLTVSVGATTTADAVIGRRSRFLGTVRNNGGQVLPGVSVTVYQDLGGEVASVQTTTTNAAGNYVLTNLPAGDYHLGFEPTSSVYVGRYYDFGSGAYFVENAGALHLDEWNDWWVDTVLERPGGLTGNVVLGGNAWARVAAFVEEGGLIELAGEATATGGGSYAIGGLKASETHVVRFVAESGAVQWYEATSTMGAATRLGWAAETTQTSVNATFTGAPVLGEIRGRVTEDGTGSNLAGMAVSAYREAGSSWDFVETTYTTGAGLYTLSGLASGLYRIEFDDPSGTHTGEYYADSATLGGGDDVTVTAPAATLGIDAALARTGAIRGQLRNRLGVPLGTVPVYAYRFSGSTWATAATDVSGASNGVYTLAGLTPGSYKVRFAGDGAYRAEFYSEYRGDISAATTVAVSEASTATGIDGVLDPRNTLPPLTTSDAPSGWQSRAVTVTLTAVDNLAVYATYCSTGGAVATYTAPLPITAEGTTTLSFCSADVVGNFEPTRTATVLIDTVAPSTTEDADASYPAGTKATVAFTASDGTSGVLKTVYAIDGGTLAEGVVAEVEGDGVHTVQYRSQDVAGNWETSRSVSFAIGAADVAYAECAGMTRFDTAVAVSRSAYTTGSCDTVIVATGRKYPDALGASALAGAADCPILLVDGATSSLLSSVKTEIQRLTSGQPTFTVYIMGGTAAVPAGIESQIKSQLTGETVVRLQGATRYDTAVECAKKVRDLAGAPIANAFLVTGQAFPDALLAGPVAFSDVRPILITNNSAAVNASVTAALAYCGTTDAQVIGTTTNVTAATATEIDSHLAGSVTRVASASSAYQQSVDVASWATGAGLLDWGGVGIATGEKYPDALGASSLLGAGGCPLLLTHATSLDAQVEAAIAAHKGSIAAVTYFGGTNAVSEDVRDSVEAALAP